MSETLDFQTWLRGQERAPLAFSDQVCDATDLLLRLFIHATEIGAKLIRIDESPDTLTARFSADSTVTTNEFLEEQELNRSLGRDLFEIANERSYYWPNLDDLCNATNQGRTARVMIAPLGAAALLADLRFQRAPGSPSRHLFVSHFQISKDHSPLALLGVNEMPATNYRALAAAKKGLILTGESPKDHTLCASSILLAMRPDALVFRGLTSRADVKPILDSAQERLVLFELKERDVVQLAYSFLRLFVGHSAEVERVLDSLVGAAIHRRIRRVCGSCSRATLLPSNVLSQLPDCLRPAEGKTYQFGRGCPTCGQSAYFGTIGIDSVFYVTEDIRTTMKQDASSHLVTKLAYRNGTRSLLEDGIEKIHAGHASFEEVLSAGGGLGTAYEEMIVENTNAGSKTTDAEKERIDGIDSSYFFSAVSEESNRPEQTPEQRRSARPPARKKHSDKKILLVVEDDEDQRDILETVFRTEGYEVVGAGNGKEALTNLQTYDVDLVVCDLMMPVMNGEQFVKAVRASAQYQTTPILMLTAVNSSEAEYNLLSLGVDDYCDKNVKRKVLLMRVERLLSRSQAGDNPLNHLLAEEN